MGTVVTVGRCRSAVPIAWSAAYAQAVRRQGSTVGFQIEYLDQHIDAIPALARWHYVEWAAITPHLSIADRVAGFRARARRGVIPTAFVAVFGADVVGLACLVECDIESHQHLTPWLASVLVAPDATSPFASVVFSALPLPDHNWGRQDKRTLQPCRQWQ